MGSKGDRIKGGWTINVDGYAPYVNAKPFITKIKDINYIEEKCSMKFSPQIRKNLINTINSYITGYEILKSKVNDDKMLDDKIRQLKKSKIEEEKKELSDEIKKIQEFLPPKFKGSGRTNINDYFPDHIRKLEAIFEEAGGKGSIGRKNPSRKHLDGFAKSQFLDFCYAVNDILPKEMQSPKAHNNSPNQGFTRRIRAVQNYKTK